MRKLAKKLKKIDIELPKWTRDVLFEHLSEVCKEIKEHEEFRKV